MLKPKNKIILANLCILASCLYTTLLFAEPQEINEPINQETNIPDDLAPAIQIEQIELYSAQPGRPETLQEKPSRPRKSILNMGKIKSASFDSAPPAVRKASEAAKTGWKTKAIQAPQPINNMVKEVPIEIQAKKKRLKAKMDGMKKGVNQRRKPEDVK